MVAIHCFFFFFFCSSEEPLFLFANVSVLVKPKSGALQIFFNSTYMHALVSYCMNVVAGNNVTNLELYMSQRHIKQTVYAKYFSERLKLIRACLRICATNGE